MERLIDLGGEVLVRERMRQKSYASRYAGSIITSLKHLIQFANYRMLQIRLSRNIFEIIQSNFLSTPDWKTEIRRRLNDLEGFEFNSNSTFSSIFFGFYKYSISRGQGKVCIKLNSFVPSSQIASPPGATHFEIISGVCESKDHSKEFKSTVVLSKIYELSDTSIGDIFFIHKISPKCNYPIFLMLGVNFYYSREGMIESFLNGDMNCFMIISSDDNHLNKRN